MRCVDLRNLAAPQINAFMHTVVVCSGVAFCCVVPVQESDGAIGAKQKWRWIYLLD